MFFESILYPLNMDLLKISLRFISRKLDICFIIDGKVVFSGIWMSGARHDFRC